MVSIIITTHGKIASGIYEALKMICGVNENVSYVDFIEGMSIEELHKSLDDKISEYLSKNRKVICLTDIKGGSPFKTVAEILLKNKDDVSLISGVNLPMSISIVSEMDEITLEEANNIALEYGKTEITEFKLINKKKEIIEEDGI